MNKIIEITVDPKGETRIETKGFSGSQCMDASKFLERALGKRTAESLTSEYFQHQSDRQSTNVSS